MGHSGDQITQHSAKHALCMWHLNLAEMRCSEEERIRIENKNPNPKMPLVRYVGGTWRVGGILALSRAFGDAYMKSSLQFEGLRASSDGYSSGFGVIAEPDTSLTDITGEALAMLCSLRTHRAAPSSRQIRGFACTVLRTALR